MFRQLSICSSAPEAECIKINMYAGNRAIGLGSRFFFAMYRVLQLFFYFRDIISLVGYHIYVN